MPQSLILLKSLPSESYLHELQEQGVYRASMSFLPGGCYAGAALWDGSTSYQARSGTMSASAAGTCPDPADTVGCLVWEILEVVRKVSPAMPLDFNAFLFLEVEAGRGSDYTDLVLRVGGEDDGTTDYVETDRGREYVAAGRLIGCGTYNTVVEVLADDHDRLLEILDQLTDVEIVTQYSVGRLAAEDTRGFGPGETADVDG
ncbi:MAG TPA: hypothetical protein VMZ11_07045 [Mycobacteriales bacterium]|nr:hypothetical protein [Mycobacteriales bacterium]